MFYSKKNWSWIWINHLSKRKLCTDLACMLNNRKWNRTAEFHIIIYQKSYAIFARVLLIYDFVFVNAFCFMSTHFHYLVYCIDMLFIYFCLCLHSFFLKDTLLDTPHGKGSSYKRLRSITPKWIFLQSHYTISLFYVKTCHLSSEHAINIYCQTKKYIFIPLDTCKKGSPRSCVKMWPSVGWNTPFLLFLFFAFPPRLKKFRLEVRKKKSWIPHCHFSSMKNMLVCGYIRFVCMYIRCLSMQAILIDDYLKITQNYTHTAKKHCKLLVVIYFINRMCPFSFIILFWVPFRLLKQVWIRFLWTPLSMPTMACEKNMLISRKYWHFI